MPQIYLDVDAALTEVPVNHIALIDSTDFVTREESVVYNQAGMDLVWNFVTSAGVHTQTAVTPTTAGDYDWGNAGNGIYTIEIPASGGASINNDTEGYGWFSGFATGILPWSGPIIGFRAAGLNDKLLDDAYSATRGLAGTALPAVAADGAGGLPISDAGGLPMDDLVQLNATAQANLEDQYDTTGIQGDNFPATQSQLSGISNVGSASHQEFTGEVLTTPATTTGGSYTDTKALDTVYMYWTGLNGGFDAELTGNIGAGTPSGIKITGYLNGANDAVRVQMWDFQAGTPAWVTVGSWSGGGSTVNQVLPFDAFVTMVGTGADLGKIRLRLYNDNGVTDTALTNASIYIDQAFVEYSPSAVSTLDAIYFDSTASNTNTVPGTDGVPGNPVSTEAAVNTLLAATNLTKVVVALESSITFAASHTYEVWTGTHWTAALGGQDFTGAHFEGADVSGIGTGTVAIDFLDCRIGTATIHPFHMKNCGFDGTLTLGATGNYVISDGHSAIAGSTTPIIDTGAALANVNLAMPGWFNGVEIRNLNAAGTDLFSISGIGQITYAASCSGSVEQRGNWKETNTGGVTINSDKQTQISTDWTNGGRLDAILDELTVQGDTNEAAIGALNDLAASDVLTQVNAALDTAIAELGIAAPTATPTLRTGLMLIYMMTRNKLVTQTSGTDALEVYNDSGVKITQKLITDAAGDYTEAEMS